MIYWTDFDFDTLPDLETVRQGRKQQYYLNGDFAVDIETSSFYVDGIKRAYPYIMMCNLCGHIVYCRYLTDLAQIFQKLKQRYKLTDRKRLIMFVHNLSYEFQFFRDICNFVDVFARSRLKPLKCMDSYSCIEFHCSYSISGLSLTNLAENLKTNIQKLSGDDFDYKKIRHSETPLTDMELKYCEHDVLILHYWILEEIAKNGGSIAKIPLTQTGYVRRECREYILNRCDRTIYKNMIKRCTPDTECFCCLHKAFAGGDTHANYLHVRHVVENVHSFDFASSYPAVMVKCKFPRKFLKLKILNRETFENLLKSKACLFKCSFEHIRAKRHHHTLSLSKCDTIMSNTKVIDNGRIVKADYVTTYFTDVDFKDFCEFYEYENMRMIEFYYSDYQYLPTPFIEYILELFKNKTELKGLTGELNEALYMKSKQAINGLYGMCVTNIVNVNAEFDNNEWIEPPELTAEQEQQEITDILDEYKNNYGSFLLYQWGVWVTAWARHFLRETIMKIEDNSPDLDGFVYCDTDSIKITDWEIHKPIIDDYNRQNEIDMINAMKYHELPLDGFKAKTKKGKVKVLGAWETDGEYQYFKTLGAKRYMYFSCDIATEKGVHNTRLKLDKFSHKWYDARYHITNAGLNKKKALPYIISHGGFDFFRKGMYIPPEHTGKSTHAYIDDYFSCDLVDYLGNVSHCEQTHYIHLQEQEYRLNIQKLFEEFLDGVTVSGQPYQHKRKILRTGAMSFGGSYSYEK